MNIFVSCLETRVTFLPTPSFVASSQICPRPSSNKVLRRESSTPPQRSLPGLAPFRSWCPPQVGGAFGSWGGPCVFHRSISILPGLDQAQQLTPARQPESSPWCNLCSTVRPSGACSSRPTAPFSSVPTFVPSCPNDPYLSRALINTGEIDARDELDSGRLIGISGTAVDLQAVDAVFVCALSPHISFPLRR